MMGVCLSKYGGCRQQKKSALNIISYWAEDEEDAEDISLAESLVDAYEES